MGNDTSKDTAADGDDSMPSSPKGRCSRRRVLGDLKPSRVAAGVTRLAAAQVIAWALRHWLG